MQRVALALLLICTGAGAAGAQEPPRDVPEVVVIGSRANVWELTGAGFYVDGEQIRAQGYDDINRVLRRAPGVYLREEDGYGLFPNISLRGVDTTRSAKITIMEDGVPTAPATYSAPAAYYAPAPGRMDGVEVLKGSSQVRWGPHTTGGVINYRSTPIPEAFSGRLRVAYGTDNEIRQHGFLGSSFDTERGRMGYLLEYYFRHNDGFKRIDATASLGDSGDTGFRRSEPLLKLFWEPRGERFSRFELKVGATDLDADETYLGLLDSDFEDDPDRRYSASRFDNIDANHLRSYLRYTRELGDGLTLVATGYYNSFRRNWFKLGGDGEDLAENVASGCWTGQIECTLPYRNNRREYYVAGAEIVADWLTSFGDTDHAIQVGLRYQQDRVRRNEDDFDFHQLGDGSIDLARSGSSGPCSGSCRWQQARALSLFVRDRIELGRLRLEPGLRFERIGNRWRDTGAGTPEDRDVLTAWSPGIGANFRVSDQLALFGGVHRGVSVPGPRDHVAKGVREETSVGVELGARLSPSPFFQAELSLFHTDFDDLLVVESLGSGNRATANVGDVNAWGLELAADFDAGAWLDLRFSNPWHLAVTLTNAELDGDAQSADVESIFSGGEDGNDVPYIPRYQINVGTALEFERLSLFLDATWVDSTFTTADNSSASRNLAGELDYSFGETDAHAVVDLSGRLRLSDRTALTLNVYNLLDEEYIASRHPIGPRPGRPRSALVGVELDF